MQFATAVTEQNIDALYRAKYGVQMPINLKNATGADRANLWLDLGKLNWQVQRRKLAMGDALGSVDETGRRNMLIEPLANFRAIVRQDTNHVFQIATDGYHVTQNFDVVNFYGDICDAGDAEMVNVGSLNEGAKVFAQVRPRVDHSKFTVGVNDKADTMLMLASSHDGSIGIIGKGTNVFIICQNTLAMAIKGQSHSGQFKFKHTRKFDAKMQAEAKLAMRITVDNALALTDAANKLAKVTIDEKGRVEFIKRLLGGESILEQVIADNSIDGLRAKGASLLDAMVESHSVAKKDESDDMGRLGKRLLDAMLNSPGSELPERSNTMWGAVNGVTYHVDHERGRSEDTRLDSAWFGTGDKLKANAVRVALDIAGLT